jgi:hypothetical protein
MNNDPAPYFLNFLYTPTEKKRLARQLTARLLKEEYPLPPNLRTFHILASPHAIPFIPGLRKHETRQERHAGLHAYFCSSDFCPIHN